MLKDLRTGILYRNSKPAVRSVHAYFPSVAVLPDGEMLATLALGEAFEATNLHTNVARSRDGGETWTLEGPIYRDRPDRLTSDCARIAATPDGEVVALMARHDRTDHPDEGLTNSETLGFVPTELLLLRSRDGGHTWSQPEPITPSLVGPSFELCSPIVPMRDGRWLLPTSTWRGWDGDCPNGMKAVAFVSHDRGHTWPEQVDVMRDPGQRVIYWESKIIELPGEELLAAAWAYDEAAGQDLPNQYAVSADGGETWSAPASTALLGQTLTPLLLDDGRILSVYRRMDEAGLWANVSRLRDGAWVNEGCEPLWGHQAVGLTRAGANMADNFRGLRFGAPCLSRLADGGIFLAFWCYEDFVSNIRWFRFRVSGKET